MVHWAKSVNTVLVNNDSYCGRRFDLSKISRSTHSSVAFWCRMVLLLKPLVLLSLATYAYGVLCGALGILDVVNTGHAAADEGCGQHHERTGNSSRSHPLEPVSSLALRRSSWLQSEKEAAGEGASKKGGEAAEKSASCAAQVFFPKLFEQAFELSKEATAKLDQCVLLMDTIKGDIDSIPHDERKHPTLSNDVKIDLANKQLSVNELAKQLRETAVKLRELEGYIGSARTQVNARLKHLLPPPPPPKK